MFFELPSLGSNPEQRSDERFNAFQSSLCRVKALEAL